LAAWGFPDRAAQFLLVADGKPNAEGEMPLDICTTAARKMCIGTRVA
jgi:hypothetical protein